MKKKYGKLVENKFMDHLHTFKANKTLIEKYGIGNAHIIWIMALYLDNSNYDELASECLTDGADDKKIDFIKLDLDNKKIVFAQGYYTEKAVDAAPANKASDLNTASAWLLSGKIEDVPELLREIIIDCRKAIAGGDIEQIDLLYVHDLPESINVTRELKTAQEHLIAALPAALGIVVIAKELGLSEAEKLFTETSSQILINSKIVCPSTIQLGEEGTDWQAGIMSVSGTWLRDLLKEHGDKLFSANYRNFLGITTRKKKNINLEIKNTAEKQPQNFWAYNNGITILTTDFEGEGGETILTGISIINGAQTTGSISSLDSHINLDKVKVLARVIKCSNPDTIEAIIKFNNTQNEITSWDKFSNDPLQKMISEQLALVGHTYNFKRGAAAEGELGIDNVIQPILSLQGYYSDTNRGKNNLFLGNLYKIAFEKTKGRHVLFAYTVSQTVDYIRIELKKKKANNTLIGLEEKQLELFSNLRFKHFFIAVFGGCLEVLLGKKVDTPKSVCFTTNESKNTLLVLQTDLLPILNFSLTITCANIPNLPKLLEDKDVLDKIAGTVSSILYASLISTENKIIEDFRKIVTVE